MFRPINPNEFEEIPLTSSNLLTYNTTNTTNTFNRINTPSPQDYKEKQKIIPWLIGSYTSLFLFCEYLQTTALIANTSHNSLSIYPYVYNLLFIWLTCYSLLNFQDIYFGEKITRFDLVVYNIACHIGGIGFALLGEIKALQNIAITSHFWHHITVADILAFIIIGCPIGIMFIKETVYAIKKRSLHRQFYEIVVFSTAYGFILSILIINKAEGIHYHVHHAICAGILSIYFLDWYSIWLIITHALLMGVVVEGINFYGLQEYYLFLLKNSPKIESTGTFITFFLFFILYNTVFFCKYQRNGG